MQDFQQIIKDHHAILFKIGRVYSDEEDFDDLYQEMLIEIWKSLKNFGGQSKLSTWLYRVALNTAMSYNRVKKRRWLPKVDFSKAENAPIEQSDHKQEEEAQIDKLLTSIQQLKKDDRSIILLYLEEKSYDEISEIVGISKSNVGVKINRIKKRLFEQLSE
jgi:RNA polymerase sigma-70 factor (ECF subfamily)